MIFPAAWLDGLTSLDVQQAGPLIDHLLKMPQGQPLPRPIINENVPLLPVAHIMAQHLTAGQLHGLGHVAPGPAVVLALGLGEGDLAGIAVPQLDPGLQHLPGSGVFLNRNILLNRKVIKYITGR